MKNNSQPKSPHPGQLRMRAGGVLGKATEDGTLEPLDEFVKLVSEKRHDVLMAYAAQFLEMTGLPVDRVELIERKFTNSEGDLCVSFRFMEVVD